MLIRVAEGRASTCFEFVRRRWCLMSTYEELMIILTIASLIVAILSYTALLTYRCRGIR